MDYKKVYEEKLISAKKAAELVKSGDWVDYGWTAGTTTAVDAELAKRVDELENINLRGGVLMRKPAIFDADPEGKVFTWNSWHAGGLERKRINAGKGGFYIPLRYSEMPKWYRENNSVDVAIVPVTPMDKHGYFNFGLNASHLHAVMEVAKIVILEVNENLPRCLGGYETDIHIDDIDYIVEGDNPEMPELPAGGWSDVDEKVAHMVVEEIPNGACLQLGIGGMPNAIGSIIADSDLKDLGVHTEMYVDAFVDMSMKGKITGAKKNIDKYRQTYAFAAGTKKLYEFLDNNPEAMAAPVDYTNASKTISQLDNFISINNAVNIDLWGQVSSESSGYKHISGAGGQLDFVLGAYESKGGKSFICLASTFETKDGELKSRIVPDFQTGSAITAARPNTHWLVTEYGKFNAKGKSTWERAEGIINLAHPDFRDKLIEDAEKMGIWRKSNKK
ncbi:MAG: butyryl-CoA:acetate CoA-transferase [Tissierellia bacterium]|nr:butyryl-CoA:acetate CoA-transferase [Tissierellia bacterium]